MKIICTSAICLIHIMLFCPVCSVIAVIGGDKYLILKSQHLVAHDNENVALCRMWHCYRYIFVRFYVLFRQCLQ